MSTSLDLSLLICKVGILMLPTSWVRERISRMTGDISTNFLVGWSCPHQGKKSLELSKGRLVERSYHSLTKSMNTCEERTCDKVGVGLEPGPGEQGPWAGHRRDFRANGQLS